MEETLDPTPNQVCCSRYSIQYTVSYMTCQDTILDPHHTLATLPAILAIQHIQV
jgi:hypothetical protein